MKLQVNTSGAWKDVIQYSPEYDLSVRKLATNLGLCSENTKLTFRIINDAGIAIAYTEMEKCHRWRDVN